jgi:hypothetical protein
MTYAPQAHVDGAGVLGVNPAKCAGEGVGALGQGDQVNMISLGKLMRTSCAYVAYI